jgi:hypothetical protein
LGAVAAAGLGGTGCELAIVVNVKAAAANAATAQRAFVVFM